ncbi:MAG: PadR family transcriptional regulator [Pseudomonadota bacterium]
MPDYLDREREFVQIDHIVTSKIARTESSADRNPAELAVLGALDLGKAHGYKLVPFLQENLFGVCSLGKSQVYALLAKLESEGLVFHENEQHRNFPSRKVFALTPEGKKLFESWLSTPVNHIRDFRMVFFIKLFFAGQRSNREKVELLRVQLKVCESKEDAFHELLRSASNELLRQAIGYRITIIKNTCSWLKSAILECED